MAQKKARGRRPGQQIDIVVDGIRVVLSLWMYRGTWVAETTLKGGRFYQAIGRSDLEVVQRIANAIRERESRYRTPDADDRPPGPSRPRGVPDRRHPGGPAGSVPPAPGEPRPPAGAPDRTAGFPSRPPPEITS